MDFLPCVEGAFMREVYFMKNLILAFFVEFGEIFLFCDHKLRIKSGPAE